MVHLLLVIIYLSFISLGLPDALLGAAWPSMCVDFHVPVSYAGGIALIISLGTVISSLMSDRLTKRFGTGKVTAFSVGLTALALFGFSVSRAYWMLCLWAIPYGLGAGSVDASLNNYVALHYASRHMSWLHCMWGLGASVGPYIMGAALTRGMGWNTGHLAISVIQIVLTAAIFLRLPLWITRKDEPGAGGVRASCHVPVERESAGGVCCALAIGGLTGGHSGVEIHKGRANANVLMGRLLYGLSQEMALRIVQMHGGQADNAIAPACEAVVLVPEEEL